MSFEMTADHLRVETTAEDAMVEHLIDALLSSQDLEMEAEEAQEAAAAAAPGTEGKRRRRRGRRSHQKRPPQPPLPEEVAAAAAGLLKPAALPESHVSNSSASLTASVCSSSPQPQPQPSEGELAAAGLLPGGAYMPPQLATLPAQYLTCSNDGRRAVPSTRNLEDIENLTVEDMQQRNVYISGLPPLFTNKELRDLVSAFGVVKTLKCCVDHEHNGRVLLQRSAAAAAAAGLPVFTHPLSGQLTPVASVDLSSYNSAVTFTKGYGFILFYTKEAAAACIAGLNDLELQDCCLKARYSETRATPFGRSSADDRNRYISCHVDKVKERQAKENGGAAPAAAHTNITNNNNINNAAMLPMASMMQQQQPQQQQMFMPSGGATVMVPQQVLMMTYVNGQPVYYQQTMMVPQVQSFLCPSMPNSVPTTFF